MALREKALLMARVIFDLDGTLVHSAPSLAAASNTLLQELDRPPLPVETIVGFVGNGIAKLVERALFASGGIPGAELERFVARYKEIYFADPVTGTEPYAGVSETLAHLADEGHALAVCTQKPNMPARTILMGLGLMPPISALTGGDSVGVLKPDPAMLWHAAEQLPGEEIVFVGDSGTDAMTAAAAGVPFLLHRNGYCHVPHENLPAFAVFDRFDELPMLIRKALERRAAS